jgi:hypothetical protein
MSPSPVAAVYVPVAAVPVAALPSPLPPSRLPVAPASGRGSRRGSEGGSGLPATGALKSDMNNASLAFRGVAGRDAMGW